MPEYDDLERRIVAWRRDLGQHVGLVADDIDELEDHLRSEYDDLVVLGLSGDEAFMVARHRLGTRDMVAGQYLSVHPDRAWAQRAQTPVGAPRWHLPLALLIGLIAGVLFRLVLTSDLDGLDHARTNAVLRGITLIPLTGLAIYLAITAKSRSAAGLAIAAIALGGAAGIAIAYPSHWAEQTLVLTATHLPVFALIVVGISYLGKRWRTIEAWMDWVRFLGEGFIFYILMALGGGVILALMYSIFGAIGIDMSVFETVIGWVYPVCAVGAVLVGAWLVERKKTAMENVAPILTAIFTPIMTLVLASFLVVVAVTGNPVEAERSVLITFDALLIVVEAIVLFTVSARPTDAGRRALDWMQMLLIVAALAVDLLSLWAMSGRLAEYGASPNKLAALVLNILLLIHLLGALIGYSRILRGRPALLLERWQAGALPVFAAWAGVVAFVFPPLFSFR